MGFDSLPATAVTSSYGGSAPVLDGFQAGVSVLMTIINIAMIPLLVVIVSLVLYYYTGNEKKADSFIPNLMSQCLRIFNYVWLYIISLVAFAGLTQVLHFIFAEILPAGDFSSDSSDSKMLAQGVVLLILMGVFAAGQVLLNRKVVEVSRIGSTMATKYFVAFGLMTFSLLMFVSVIGVFMNIVDYVDDSSYGMNGSLVALMFASITFFALYLTKGMDVLKRESVK